MNNLKKILLTMYLDYVNNFLTISDFADYYGISEQLATAIINEFKSN